MIDISYNIDNDFKAFRAFYDTYHFNDANEDLKDDIYSIFYTLILAFLIPSFIYYLFKDTKVHWYIGFTIAFFFGTLYYAFKNILEIFKDYKTIKLQRKGLEDWYTHLKRIKAARLILNDEKLVFYEDDTIFEYNWSAFTGYNILDDLIVLHQENNGKFFIVKESVGHDHYDTISTFIPTKITQAVSDEE